MRRFFLLLSLILTSCIVANDPVDLEDLNVKLSRVTIYDTIIIEVLPSKDYKPSKDFQEEFKKHLEEINICNAKNIHFIIRCASLTKKLKWTYREIRLYESQHRLLHDLTPKDRNLVVFVSCLPGHNIKLNRTNIIGLKYGPTSIAYFTRNPKLELSIWLHEFGHLVGLTRGRKNPDRPLHCNNEKCVMFWRCSGQIIFDELCRKDLRRIAKNRSQIK